MANKLLHKCDVCNSWFWCGRQCGRAPDYDPLIPNAATEAVIEEYDKSKRDGTLEESITLEDGSEIVFAGDGDPIRGTEGGGIVAEGPPLPSYKYRDPEKRRAYMKEYMRKRRAKGVDQDAD